MAAAVCLIEQEAALADVDAALMAFENDLNDVEALFNAGELE